MNRALLEDVLYALEYASDMTKPEGLSGCDCPICTVIPKVKAELAKPEPAPEFHPDWANYRQGIKDARDEFSQNPVAWMTRSDEILPTFHRTKEAAAFWSDDPVPLYLGVKNES